MSKHQHIDQDQFYSILEGLRQASAEELGESGAELQRPHSSADEFDSVEVAFGSQQDQTSASRHELERVRLRAIEEAEDRLATGCYGICMACGEDIPVRRLLAEPTAVRCVSCQQQFENSSAALTTA